MTKKTKKGKLKGFTMKSKSKLCALKVRDHKPEEMREIGEELIELATYILTTLGDKFGSTPSNVALVRARVNKETGEVELDTRDLDQKIARAAKADVEKEDTDCNCLKCMVRNMLETMESDMESVTP